MGTRRQFSREFKLEAVRLVQGARGVGGAGCARSRRARERAAQVGSGLGGGSAAGVSRPGRR